MIATAVVPEQVVKKIEGCWDLGSSYRITLRRSGSCLKADQEAVTRLGKKDLQDQAVQFNASDGTLGFTGIGAIHPTIIMLRLAGVELEFAFSSEIAHGKWMQDEWKRARRCVPDPTK